MVVLNYVRDNVQVSHTGFWDILLLTLSINKGLVGVLARGFLFNCLAPYCDFSVIFFGLLFLIILQGGVWEPFSEEKLLNIQPIVWN